MAPRTVWKSTTGRCQRAFAIAIGAAATIKMFSTKNAPVASCDEQIATDTNEETKATSATSAAMRSVRRRTSDARSAASRVRPWSATVTTRTHELVMPLAMNTNVISRSSSTSPKRYPSSFRSSQRSIARGSCCRSRPSGADPKDPAIEHRGSRRRQVGAREMRAQITEAFQHLAHVRDGRQAGTTIASTVAWASRAQHSQETHHAHLREAWCRKSHRGRRTCRELGLLP